MPQGQSDALVKAYRLAVQLLFMLALPIAVAFTFLATPLIRILGGAAYLPDSAIALQFMVWSIPIGWVNSVTQYVLISVNQQRFLTRAFIIGVVFTGVANLILVPHLRLSRGCAAPAPGRIGALHPVRLGGAPSCGADALAQAVAGVRCWPPASMSASFGA